ncbi:MAG: EthD family reductase [Actinomycetota bacterium]|nr:EthD family reductase [Actinomycetota bacterium]
MIKVSVFYPNSEGSTFDHDYYKNSHVPLAASTWGLDKSQIERGVEGPYVAAVHFEFPSVDEYRSAMAREGTAAVLADIPNYTNIRPVIQVSEIVE